MKPVDVDNLLDALGKPGKFQTVSFIFLCANAWFVLTNHMAMVFFAAKTDHTCQMDTDVVTGNGAVEVDECFVLLANRSEKKECTEWDYNLAEDETTIISEFDLVCNDAFKADLATTVYFAGVMIGGIIFGILADKYGRKRVVVCALLLSGIVSIATFIFRTFAAFIILRFFLGVFIQGVQNSSFILALENLSLKYRTHYCLVFCISGAIGILLLDLLAFVVKDWKYVQLCLGLLPFVQTLTLWFVPESIRWHILHKNFNEAEAIVQRIVAFNKLTFPRKLFDKIKTDALNREYTQDERKGNILDVFKSPKLRKITIALCPLWFTFSAGYYGLAFHISFLFGNKYLNFAISTILDVGVSSMLLWIVPRYGRRRPLIVFFSLCVMANGVCSVIASQSVSGPVEYLGTAMAMIGKTAIACCGVIGYVFTSELYPTVVRNVSLGLNTFWIRVGGMAAPQIFFLGEYSSEFVPYAILTALSFTSCCMVLLLPETHNKRLTDRLEVSMSSLLSCDHGNGDIDQSDSSRKKAQCYETSI